MPVELIKNEDTNSKARLLFRKTKFPYHLKLIIRNVFTYKKKNICMILSTTLLLGIVLAVFFLETSINYTDTTLAKETFNAEYYLNIPNYYTDDIEQKILTKESPIYDSYYLSTIAIKTEYENVREDLYIFDSTKPSIKLIDESGNNLDYSSNGLFLPSSYKKYNLNVGDTINIYTSLDDYYSIYSLNIAGFINEVGLTKFAISKQTLIKINPLLEDILDKLNTPLFIKLKDGYSTNDLEEYIKSNFEVKNLVTNYNNNLNFDYYSPEVLDNVNIFESCSYKNLTIKNILTNNNDELHLFDFYEGYLTLYSPDNNKIDLMSDGVYINESLALNHNLKIGDYLYIAYQNAIIPLKINGITNSNYSIVSDINYFNLLLSLLGFEKVEAGILFNSNDSVENLISTTSNVEFFNNQNLSDISSINIGIKSNLIKDEEFYEEIKSSITAFRTEEALITKDNFTFSNNITIINNKNIFKEINSDGIYIPENQQSIFEKGDIITIRINNIDYNCKVAGYTNNTKLGAIVSSKYLKSIDENYKFSSYNYLIKNKDISAVNDILIKETKNNNYSIDEISTFKRNMGIIYDLIDVTKYISIFLAGLIFILLTYNIGVICLGNRLNDIKCFKAAGLKESKLNHLLTYENIFVVTLGAIFSVPIGILICKIILKQIYIITTIKMIFSISIIAIIIIIFISIILMLISSYLINRKVNKLDLAMLLKER